jgi:exodeoxyribonuclease VII large subunit
MDHLSLIELNKLIQDTLKKNLEPSYWIIAEIGELKVTQKGHCYLELLQNENNKAVAKVRATIWSYTYRNLSTWFQGITGQPLAEGLKILANIKINIHELYGYSLNIQDIDASYTIGEKEKIRQEVINRLVSDGVIGMNQELTLPLVPQKIAVISSPTAAGYGDFLQHIDENPYAYIVETTLFEAIMQGSEAPESIIRALHRINEADNYDLIVLIRGGGSQLDLECFDNYELCSHLAQYPSPVITGIGHERDETIADMVAHTKLKTPTAVAEFILQGISSFEVLLNDEAAKISKMASLILQNTATRLMSIGTTIRMQAQSVVLNENHQLGTLTEQLKHKTQQQLKQQGNKIALIEAQHRHLNPANAFKRGFSFSTIDGVSVLGSKAKRGKNLITYSLNQTIESTITAVKKNGKI